MTSYKDAQQALWNHLSYEHGLVLMESELSELVALAVAVEAVQEAAWV